MLSLRGPASHDVILETGLLTEGGDWLGVALVRLLPPRLWFLPRLLAALAASTRRVAAAVRQGSFAFCAERITRPGLVWQSNRGKTRMRFRESRRLRRLREAGGRGWRIR